MAIGGASSSSYKVAAADAGKKLSVAVTGAKSGYTSKKVTSAQVAVPAPLKPMTGATAAVTGSAAVGHVALTAKPSGFPAGTTLKYQWLRDGVAIGGASSSTYKIAAADAGKKLSVAVTGSKSGYTTTKVTSAQVTVPSPGKEMTGAKVTTTGSAYTGQTRTAQATGFPAGTTLAYQWSVNGAAVKGATARTFMLPQSAAGKTVAVAVKGTKSGYRTTTVTTSFAAKDINTTLRYRGHVQTIGWQDWVTGGKTAGTSGRSLRVEALTFSLQGEPVTGSITASGHVQRIGWMSNVSEGSIVGTSGRSLRVEAFTMKLTGTMAQQYDIWYRTHAQSFGWLGWTKNGAQSGSAGYARRLEAVQVIILPKGTPAPGPTTTPFHKR